MAGSCTRARFVFYIWGSRSYCRRNCDNKFDFPYALCLSFVCATVFCKGVYSRTCTPRELSQLYLHYETPSMPLSSTSSFVIQRAHLRQGSHPPFLASPPPFSSSVAAPGTASPTSFARSLRAEACADSASALRPESSECDADASAPSGFRLRVGGLGFRVQGSGFRV